jgi:formyltetrahydrofolate deformylase
MNDVHAILLLSCPDCKGLVAKISNFIFNYNGNIVHADQYSAKREKMFFMRIEWELEGFSLDREEIAVEFAKIASPLAMKWELHFTDYAPRIAVFVSKHLHCLHDLILRHRLGEFKAEIPLVISNHPDARDSVEQLGLKYCYFPITEQNKTRQEKLEIQLLRDMNIDLIVLARYMQILTGKFLKAYPRKIINIHHSFLPAFAGGNPYRQAYNRGVKIIGATGHYVTETLDEGPIIAQDVIKISHRDEIASIQTKSRDLERIVLARAMRLHLEYRILVHGAKTVVFE